MYFLLFIYFLFSKNRAEKRIQSYEYFSSWTNFFLWILKNIRRFVACSQSLIAGILWSLFLTLLKNYLFQERKVTNLNPFKQIFFSLLRKFLSTCLLCSQTDTIPNNYETVQTICYCWYIAELNIVIILFAESRVVKFSFLDKKTPSELTQKVLSK